MLLDLTEIARIPGSRASHTFSEQLADEEDFSFAAPVKGSLTVANGRDILVLRGGLKTRVKLTCARCLEEFEQTVETGLSEDFSVSPSLPASEKEAVEMDSPREPIFREGELDLTELLRQMVLVSLPLVAVCREDCLGICPRCGRNRNRGECECPPEEEPGGPLESLKDLLSRETGS